MTEKITASAAIMILRDRCIRKFKEAAKDPAFKERYLAQDSLGLSETNEMLYNDLTGDAPPRFWSIAYCLVLAGHMGLDQFKEERELYQTITQEAYINGESTTRWMVDRPAD